MGNAIASGALLAWPVVTLVLFLTLSTPRAIVASLVGAYLVLPYSVGFDVKGIPALDKSSIPNIATFLIALCLAPTGAFRWPRSFWFNLLLIVYVLSPALTAISNADAISIGTVMLPGMTLNDAISGVVGNAIAVMPMIVGVAMLGSERAHRDLLWIFVIAALAYSAPILLEVAKGPYLQAVIYRVDPGGWYEQQIRNGGFRAIVFIGHGLLVSTFLGLALLAAAGLWRDKKRIMGVPAVLCAAWIFLILILNKSAGALITVILIAPLLILLPARRFIKLALAAGLILVTYPAMRAAGWIPVETIRTAASSISKDRAGSLDFRLRNEDVLLDRANQRPLFGWGGYKRNRVFVVTSWGATTDVTETDGTWIITLGSYGWTGYLSLFGLLCYPFLHIYRLRRAGLAPATVALLAMLLFNLLDLIPNSSLRPITWLIAGALAGFTAVRPRLQRPHGLAHLTGTQPDRAHRVA